MKLRTFSVILVSLLAALAVFGGGCWRTEGEAAATQTIVDGAGREVVVPVKVNRIVSLVTGVTGILYEIDAGDKVVGVTKALPYPTTYYYPQVEDLADVGSIANINVEKVMEVEPDLVFTTEFFVKQAASLEERGITVVAIRTDSLKDLVWNVRFIGSLVDRRTEADVLAERMEATIASVRERTEPLEREVRPKVYVEGTSLITYGADTYCNESVIAAGGINLYGDSPVKMPRPNLEYVIEQNPDRILLFEVAENKEEFVEKARARIEEIKGRPGWSSITAVKNSQICVVENRYLNFGPDHAQSIAAMAKFFYPDAFSDFSMPDYVYMESQ